jgi:hypothetical protein
MASRQSVVLRQPSRYGSRSTAYRCFWSGNYGRAHSLACLLVGFVAVALLNYLVFFTLADLAFPVAEHYVALGPDPAYGGPPLPWDLWLGIHRVPYHGGFWASTYRTSNGGPTLAGAWTYHTVQQFVTIFPLLAWTIRGLTRLAAWLTQAILGGPAVDPVGAVRAAVASPA